MATGDDIHVVNDSVAPNKTLTDLGGQTLDANGNSLANSSFSFVVWGVANRTGTQSHLMVNLPTGVYAKNNPEFAVSDPTNYSVYDIPKQFQGVGFLIARFTFVLQAGGTSWSLYSTEDLRGKSPNISAGGGAGGGGVSTFLGLTDTPSAYVASSIPFANAGGTALEFDANLTWNGTQENILSDNQLDAMQVRHTGLTRGMGIGWVGMKALGTDTNIHLSIVSKGTGGIWLGQNNAETGIKVDPGNPINTLYFGDTSVGLTANSGNRISIGLVNSSTPGLSVLTTSGNVGAGTILPDYQLHVNHAANETVIMAGFGVNNTAVMRIGYTRGVSTATSSATLDTEVSSRSISLQSNSGGSVGIGTITSPHGGIGTAKLAIEGANANAAGPHIQFTTASDDYPLLQVLPWTHDNVNLLFDSYFDGLNFRSSDAGSSLRMEKTGDKLKFGYDTVAVGDVITWNDGIVMDLTNGNVGIGLAPTANMAGLSIEAGLLTLKERATPTADTNYGKIYTKADNKFYAQTGDGVEHEIAFV
jgi:hypothetical protein